MFDFKRKLQDTDARLTAHICTIPSATVTQAMAAAGADAVIIDLEHGAVDYGSAHAMIAATAGTQCAPLVRIAENRASEVKRVLDLGAEGIVFPLIRTAGDAERAVASLRYPPHGNRGFGPFIAHSRTQVPFSGYLPTVADNLLCCLLAETREAVDNIDAICAVPGVDLIIPAQFDLSVDLGVPGRFDAPEFVEAVEKIESAARSAGIPLGNAALDRPRAEALFDRGYRVIAGFDILWLKAVAAENQSWTRT